MNNDYDKFREEITRIRANKDFKEPDCILIPYICRFCGSEKKVKMIDVEFDIPVPICAMCYQTMLTNVILDDIRNDTLEIISNSIDGNG